MNTHPRKPKSCDQLTLNYDSGQSRVGESPMQLNDGRGFPMPDTIILPKDNGFDNIRTPILLFTDETGHVRHCALSQIQTSQLLTKWAEETQVFEDMDLPFAVYQESRYIQRSVVKEDISPYAGLQNCLFVPSVRSSSRLLSRRELRDLLKSKAAYASEINTDHSDEDQERTEQGRRIANLAFVKRFVPSSRRRTVVWKAEFQKGAANMKIQEFTYAHTHNSAHTHAIIRCIPTSPHYR